MVRQPFSCLLCCPVLIEFSIQTVTAEAMKKKFKSQSIMASLGFTDPVSFDSQENPRILAVLGSAESADFSAEEETAMKSCWALCRRSDRQEEVVVPIQPASSAAMRVMLMMERAIAHALGRDGESRPITSLRYTSIFSYSELEEATDGFHKSRVLGNGGFSTVYQGKLRDGRIVAIKVLKADIPKRLEKFYIEVFVVSYLRHQNLVALYGCTDPCSSHRNRDLALVYELVPNGTVADYLHGKRGTLTWAMRMQIAIKTAEALAYLHSLSPSVIHRDIKTDNILLDNNFAAKVTDLGLCHLISSNETVLTALQGTQGYLDPEYENGCKLNDKSDVYSFGVVLVQLISGKVAVDIEQEPNEIYLTGMILYRKLKQLVDPKLGYESNFEIRWMVNSVAALACRCLQPKGNTRPPMVEVLMILKRIDDGTLVPDANARDDIEELLNKVNFCNIGTAITPFYNSSSSKPNASTKESSEDVQDV